MVELSALGDDKERISQSFNVCNLSIKEAENEDMN